MTTHKAYSVIHVTGLAIGITACLLLALYVADELNFDRYHPDYERIYRINRTIENDMGTEWTDRTPGPLKQVLEADYPQVTSVCRFWQNMAVVVHLPDNNLFYDESNHVFADPEFFDMFDFRFLAGSAFLYRNMPNALIISEDIARQLFQKTDIAGQTLNINESQYTIAGVIMNVPHNTHLPKFKFATMLEDIGSSVHYESWVHGVGVKTYVRLKNGVRPEDFEKQIGRIMDRYASGAMKEAGMACTFSLQPVGRIHLCRDLEHPDKNTKAARLALLSLIALLILFIACLNFVNISTARATVRTREIGIRKTIGAQRKQLIMQLLGESVAVSMIAAVIAVIFTACLMPWFNAFTLKQIGVQTISPFIIAGILVVVVGITGLAGGLYPAFYLSALEPVSLFINALAGRKRGAAASRFSLRKVLVIIQFVITCIFISAILVISRQIHFMKNRDLGFNRESVIVLPVHTVELCRYLKNNMQAVKNELTAYHAVESVTYHLKSPGRMEHQNDIALIRDGREIRKWVNMQFTDHDFLPTYGIPLAAGRNFSPQAPNSQATQFLLNRAALSAYGFRIPEQAVGSEMSIFHFTGEVTGVTEDFHYWSLKYTVEPMVLVRCPILFPEAVSLKIKKGYASEAIAFVEATLRKRVPSQPVQVYFLDRDFDRVYRSEEKTRAMILVSAGLAVIIACMGLFGLVLFTAERRTKEIGIRKVLGLSVPGIWMLVVSDFIKWIGLASVIALPAGWMIMRHWLDDYACRIDLTVWPFLLSGLMALGIALLTVSWLVIRAARANPVESLRYE